MDLILHDTATAEVTGKLEIGDIFLWDLGFGIWDLDLEEGCGRHDYDYDYMYTENE